MPFPRKLPCAATAGDTRNAASPGKPSGKLLLIISVLLLLLWPLLLSSTLLLLLLPARRTVLLVLLPLYCLSAGALDVPPLLPLLPGAMLLSMLLMLPTGPGALAEIDRARSLGDTGASMLLLMLPAALLANRTSGTALQSLLTSGCTPGRTAAGGVPMWQVCSLAPGMAC
jgi:hypothetical protein